jgi:hypothetical protein
LDPTRFAYDFDGAKATWGALADTAKYADPMYALTHPIGAFEHGKDMVEGLVHAEDWRSDRLGLGAGGLGFEAVTSITGVGAAKSATKGAVEAAETAAERAAPRALSGSAAEVSNIGENLSKVTEKLDKLDDIPTGGALPGSNGPTIPPSLTEPKAPVAPNIPDAPAPRGLPEPTAPHTSGAPTPHVPEPKPVDTTPTAPHSSTPTSTPTHTPAAPGETPHTGTAPISATPESRVPTAEAPSAPHQSAPTQAPSAAPTAGHAPEPVSGAAHPSSSPSASHAPETAPPAGHAPSSPAPEASPSTHGESPGSGTGTGHSSDGPAPHEPHHPADHDGNGSDGHAAGDDGNHSDGHHPRTGAEAFPDAHDYGDLTEEQFDHEFRNDDGSLRYPDENDPAKPYAIPGTVHDLSPAEIKSRLDGQVWDRLGHPGGAWLAPEGTPYGERSLAPESLEREYHGYLVHAENPLPAGWRIEESRAAPWFGQPGGGPQFRVISPPGVKPRVADLIGTDFLEELW